MQELIIVLVFAGALAYLGRRIYRSFFVSKQAGCGKGCGCAVETKPGVRLTEK
ncbi:FeoB-associated Cys-rich membrane protein [Spirosoma aerolatum]|uniref:FeoB-associated Cys-rich membrane protein n=1 Tax=Spirosoma aerolatum TaxID=1211326 RepID=UPI0012D2F405|nr:FeoB-associated Cys-rich membrane protein [Spirosoma aerolatum]